MRRVIRIISVALITTGIVLLTDAALTIAWKEPLSAIYGSIQQKHAKDDLEAASESFLEIPRLDHLKFDNADSPRAASEVADVFSSTLEIGNPIGQIEIPSIGVDYVVIEGTEPAGLKRGPGHYPETGLPGQGTTIGIAGHRTTYLAPFREVDQINDGDEVVLKMPYGEFTYLVTKTEIVEPTQTEIVDDVGRERLVLTACHPLYSAAQRYAVFADLDHFELAPR